MTIAPQTRSPHNTKDVSMTMNAPAMTTGYNLYASKLAPELADDEVARRYLATTVENLPERWAVLALDECILEVLLDEDCLGQRCLCRHRLRDHAMTMLDPGGIFVTWHPYTTRVTVSALAELDVLARHHGVALKISPASPYYPGHTFMLTFRKAARP